jgi:alpha-glucosidase (family GH31 glycosyl hydrolase)
MMIVRHSCHAFTQAMSALLFALALPQPVQAETVRKIIKAPSAYMVVEILDDDLIHVEVSSVGPTPSDDKPVYTSPMVLKTDHAGPSAISDQGSILETAQIRIEIDPGNLCATFRDKTKGGAFLTTICPVDLDQSRKGLDIDPGSISHVYGLGEEFIKRTPESDGDWTALGMRAGGALGNTFQGFLGGAVGNVQIPVMYGVSRDGSVNYGLFLDNVYRHQWDFKVSWWQVRTFGDHLRYYVMTGPDLLDIRKDYMTLTGTPPVPPRKAFGLWVSEFGYDNWDQVDALASGLRQARFPVDGFVLDLNWFGGVSLNDSSRSNMGRLNWDQDQDPLAASNTYRFPDPGTKIRQYADNQIGIAAIEEAYVANTTDTFSQMPAPLSAYERRNGICDPAQQNNALTTVEGFWGKGRMIDWSDPEAGRWVHDQRRFPNLVRNGITVHWTDLGEPESFNGAACYDGIEPLGATRKNEHSDIHNLYNLLWNRSIWQGYVDRQGQADGLGTINPRPFILTRSGAAGSQRYGAAMWSGDIASNLPSLATHFNVQMHIAMSGIDYFGSDIGGFRREAMPHNDKAGSYRGYEDELYTQWLANGAWFDIPVRPHTDNEFVQASPPYATAPHLIGDPASNLANLRQRYSLTPYYYSLAYRAHLFGEPVIPPLVLYYQNDPKVRDIGHEKLIGRDLLVGTVARHGEYERDIYLPAGTWANYHTNEWVRSEGTWLRNVPVYRDGLLQLPVFGRAGAIIPQMPVHEDTLDVFGRRATGPSDESLTVTAYADPVPSSFTLYEDDGRTLDYNSLGRPAYPYRTTVLRQQGDQHMAEVTVEPATNVGNPSGIPLERAHLIRLVVNGAEASGVTLNGNPLSRHTTRDALDAATSGWLNAGNNVILAKSERMAVLDGAKTFRFSLQPVAHTTSVNFVCDRGVTRPGTSVYVVGNIPSLGAWDPGKAVRLSPSVYYNYIINPPPNQSGPGPVAPVWTGVIHGLPTGTSVEWKCIRRRESGMGPVEWQAGSNNVHMTGSDGFSGRTYGAF